MIARWRASLRMARRQLLRRKVSAALCLALVALPVTVATTLAMFQHNLASDGEALAREVMGGADARIQVTPFASVRVRYVDNTALAVPRERRRDDDGRRRPVRRPVDDVDLPALLPEGTRLVPAPVQRPVALDTGGVATVHVVDATDPITRGLYRDVVVGTAPDAPDEAALGEAMAREFGLLDGDRLRDDATVTLRGTTLRVVGLLRPSPWSSSSESAAVLVPPDSTLAPDRPHPWLADLPPMGREELKALSAALAAEGVSLQPRDALLHPRAWGPESSVRGAVDMTALTVAALAILVGLVEVVIVVGAAFAVSARRQVRDLALLAASGGAPSDVRRALLAQGLVLGAGGAALGAAAGIGAFYAGVPVYESLRHQTVWTRDVPVVPVLVVTILGSLTGVCAALAPAWSIGRLSAVAALSGRFPIRTGEARAHRGALMLVAAGLGVLGVGGWWTSAAWRVGRSRGDAESPLPVALAALGFVLLVAGVVWLAPAAVRTTARLGHRLPLASRYACRDAARHRFRSGAAALALAITMAAAVLVGFATTGSARAAGGDGGDGDRPAHAVGVYPGGRAQEATAIEETLQRILGPAQVLVSDGVRDGAGQVADLQLVGSRDMWQPVGIVGEEEIAYFVAPVDRAEALTAFRAGRLVVATGHRVDATARIAWWPGSRRPERVEVDAVSVAARYSGVEFPQAWMSRDAAAALGLETGFSQAMAVAERTVTSEDLERLAVNGLDAWSTDPDTQTRHTTTLLAVGGAGLLAALIAGIAVALAAAEGRADSATLAAVGAPPGRRRLIGAFHGLFLAVVGSGLGLLVSIPAGLSFGQADGLPGAGVPVLAIAGLVLSVLLFAAAAGWAVTPSRLSLVRRAG